MAVPNFNSTNLNNKMNQDLHYKIFYYLEKASQLQLEAIKYNISSHFDQAAKCDIKSADYIQLASNLQKQL